LRAERASVVGGSVTTYADAEAPRARRVIAVNLMMDMDMKMGVGKMERIARIWPAESVKSGPRVGTRRDEMEWEGMSTLVV
jgi:hypothetical protein